MRVRRGHDEIDHITVYITIYHKLGQTYGSLSSSHCGLITAFRLWIITPVLYTSVTVPVEHCS